MKVRNSVPKGILGVFLILSLTIVAMVVVNIKTSRVLASEEVCPEGDGWVKQNWPENWGSRDYFALSGKKIDGVCVKGGQLLEYYSSDGTRHCWKVDFQNGKTKITISEWHCDGAGRGEPDISHVSYHLVPSCPGPSATPVPTIVPTVKPTDKPEPTPTIEPTPTNEPTPSDKPEPTPTIGPNPTEKPTPTDEPTPTDKPEPTPTDKPEEAPTPTPTETPDETPTPTPTNTPDDEDDNDDEDSDDSGVGGGDVLGTTTDNGGEVLGLTSYADTGVAEEMLMNLMTLGGMLMTAVGAIGYKKVNE